MSILSELEFSAPVSGNDPVASAKSSLLRNLEAQFEAANQMVEGKSSSLSERQKWYARRDHSGNMLFCVKVRNKPIEFQKGKPFIIVPDDKKLPATIEQVIKAVQAGELNVQIEARVKERQKSKPARS
jgi:hypothetical protein